MSTDLVKTQNMKSLMSAPLGAELKKSDPSPNYLEIVFRDDGLTMDAENEVSSVHIRMQPHGRHKVTTISGLPATVDLKRMAKTLRKAFQCSGIVKVDDDHGCILQLSGDQKVRVREFLIDTGICESGDIVVHGA